VLYKDASRINDRDQRLKKPLFSPFPFLIIAGSFFCVDYYFLKKEAATFPHFSVDTVGFRSSGDNSEKLRGREAKSIVL